MVETVRGTGVIFSDHGDLGCGSTGVPELKPCPVLYNGTRIMLSESLSSTHSPEITKAGEYTKPSLFHQEKSLLNSQ
jgi:hypothetical protein